MEGIDKARKIVDKIKAEVEAKKQEEEKTMTTIKNQIQTVVDNKELAKLFNDNAETGAENLSGTAPTLSVFTAGKSQSRLADGTKPNDGWFFYKPTEEQFESVDVHILTVSRGFYAEGMSRPNKKTKQVWNQIISGLIVSTEKPLPFIMYLTGKKLQPMWDFGKEARKYTRAKPVAIPMFTLFVRLKTHEEKTDFGTSWVIDFKILKNDDDTPIVPTEVSEILRLKDLLEQGNTMIESIIANKEIDDDSVSMQIKGATSVEENVELTQEKEKIPF